MMTVTSPVGCAWVALGIKTEPTRRPVDGHPLSARVLEPQVLGSNPRGRTREAQFRCGPGGEGCAPVQPSLWLFVRLAATTGARRGELCALRWKAVDLVDATVRIEASGYSERGGPVQIKDTKNHSRRVVSLDDSTVARISDHLEQMGLRASACGVELSPESFVLHTTPTVYAHGDPTTSAAPGLGFATRSASLA